MVFIMPAVHTIIVYLSLTQKALIAIDFTVAVIFALFGMLPSYLSFLPVFVLSL